MTSSPEVPETTWLRWKSSSQMIESTPCPSPLSSAASKSLGAISVTAPNSLSSVISPRAISDRPSPVKPVASLQGRILQIRTVQPGETVGYSGSWTAEKQTRIAAVGIGYADGVPRHLSGVGEMALKDGTRCPIIGRVSMDTTVLDISAAGEVQIGAWAESFGAHIPVDEAAGHAGTLGYELLTRVGERVPRVPGSLG